MIAGEGLEGYDWPGKSDRWLGATRIARVRHHDGVSLENGWTEAASDRPSAADRRHALAARSRRQRGRPGKHHRVWGAGGIVDRMARSARSPRDTASEQRREGRAMLPRWGRGFVVARPAVNSGALLEGWHAAGQAAPVRDMARSGPPTRNRTSISGLEDPCSIR